MKNQEDTQKEPLIVQDTKLPASTTISRSRTMGIRVTDKKTIFQWTADGKLQEVKVNPVPEDTRSDNEPEKPSKFGSLQNLALSNGPKSVRSGFSTATTEVAFSNYNYPKADEDQDDGAVFLKIRGKPGITKKNLILIPLLMTLLLFSGVDVLQTSSQMLSSTESYNLGTDKAAKVNTQSMTIASFASIFVLLFGGIIYDLLGRRATVAICFIVGACSTVPLPFGKNLGASVDYYTFFKVIFNCTFVPLVANPFINDYVRVQDRGLAMGIQNFGMTIGTLLSVGVLYTITSKFSYALTFAILACLQILWLILIVVAGMISEPTQMSEREVRKQNKKSVFGKIFSVLKQTWKACKQDHALAIGLIAVSVSRQGIMLQQVTFYNWINSFGLENAKGIWQMQNLITNVCAIPFVIVTGKVADKISAKILIPAALIFQIVVMTAYCFVQSPADWGAYACAVFQGGTGMCVVVTLCTYISKRTPKNIRGMIFAIIGVMGAIGSIVYLEIYNALFHYGTWMAFGVIAMIDSVMLLFVLAMIAMGKFGQAAAGTEDGEDQEEMDLRGPDAGAGGYADIPKLETNEVYDEKILEADEEYERSTLRGSIVIKRKGSSKVDSLIQNDINLRVNATGNLADDYDPDSDDKDDMLRGSINSKRNKLKDSVVSIPVIDENDYDPDSLKQGKQIAYGSAQQRSISYAHNNFEPSSVHFQTKIDGMAPIAENDDEYSDRGDDIGEVLAATQRRKNRRKKGRVIRSLSADGVRIAENRMF